MSNGFEILSSLCRSPIERMFLDGLYADQWFEGAQHVQCPDHSPVWTHGYQVCPQHRIGPYRVDFHIRYRIMLGRLIETEVVVELDGHAFHEKTKEQVARDKARERYIVGTGLHVMRFSGSEINRDALKCAAEVDSFLLSEAARRQRVRRA